MKYILVLLVTLPLRVLAQVIPQGYILQYDQNFTNKNALSQFRTEGNGEISISRNGSNYFITAGFNEGENNGTAPLTGILKDYIFGDFIMEFDAMLSGKADTIDGFFTFYSYRDSGNYYFIKLSSSWFDKAGGIFIKHRTVNSRLQGDSLNAWKLSGEKWTHFRLERNITTRTIKFFCNDMNNPVIQVADPRLVMGYVGFGSSGGSFYIDNIKIWAPTFIPGE